MPGDSNEVSWERDVENEARLLRDLRSGRKIDSVVPAKFDFYLQMPHDLRVDRKYVSWSTLAREFHIDCASPRRYLDAKRALGSQAEPLVGNPSPTQVTQLLSVFGGIGQSTDVHHFCLWEGYAAVSGVSKALDGRTVSTPVAPKAPLAEGPMSRRYFVHRGRLGDAIDVGRVAQKTAPDFWWPDNLDWFVACDMDLPVTYIGCTQAIADQLLDRQNPVILPASIDDLVVSQSALRAGLS